MSQKGSANKERSDEQVRPHQPGQEVFKAVLPEDIEWKPFAAFPPSVRLAVVVGEPAETSPLHNQGKSAARREANASQAPGVSGYTVISGVFYVGLGDEFDATKLEAYPPAAVSFSRPVRLASIGQNPASTSRK